MKPNSFMEHALTLAQKAATLEEVPVGAVIVHSITGEIIAESYNQVESTPNPAAHAELLAITQACQKLNSPRLPECDIYVTLEPCPMCAQAISFARIRRVYFGAYDPKGGGVDHGARIFEASSCHHKPEVYGGIGEREAGKLLQDFFQKRR